VNVLPVEIIKKKRNKVPLTDEEIQFFINQYTAGILADYQMASFLMAVFLNGMNEIETLALTKAMLYSGKTVHFDKLSKFKVDKHSTGGVGDKTSLILAPIVAAAGVPVPMISGRGLGHTGGTLDKLESIPGFSTDKSLNEFIELTEKFGLCFIGQTSEICPADKKIYALRDVTGTVESIPLICASILSKKLAEGIDGLVLDIKCGNGAFMKTLKEAQALGNALETVCHLFTKKVNITYSDMSQPLGRFAGNLHEVFEAMEILNNRKYLNSNGTDLYADTRNLSLYLASKMIQMGLNISFNEAQEVANEQLESGKASKVFNVICRAQGGYLDKLPLPSQKIIIPAREDGFLASYNTERIGIAGIRIRAGRQKYDDQIEHQNGIEFHFKIGDAIKAGEPLFSLHGNNLKTLEEGKDLLNSCYSISLQKVERPDLILN